MENVKFKVGDLVLYQPSEENRYADGTKQLGVILRVKKDVNPLFTLHPETKMFACEYVVKWFQSGYVSALLPFNLKKLQIPVDKNE